MIWVQCLSVPTGDGETFVCCATDSCVDEVTVSINEAWKHGRISTETPYDRNVAFLFHCVFIGTGENDFAVGDHHRLHIACLVAFHREDGATMDDESCPRVAGLGLIAGTQ